MIVFLKIDLMLLETSMSFEFEEDAIDRQPVSEHCRGRSKILDPNKKCKDRFFITDNRTLVVNYSGIAYQTAQFCIDLSLEAKTKHNHLAHICLKNEPETRHS